MKTSRRLLLISRVPAAAVLVAVLAWCWTPQERAGTETLYAKHEYRIAMRDGVKLFTQVYIPKDASRSYPVLMMRTPFGVVPYGENQFRKQLGPSQKFDGSGYIFV